MTVLGILPARAGSKRLPGKNTRELGGRPLFAWALAAAEASRGVDRWLVSSDDEEVLELGRQSSVAEALERPAELAADQSPAIDYVEHAVAFHEAGPHPGGPIEPVDIVVIVQPTSPFVEASDIEATLDLLQSTGADTAVSVVKLDHAIQPAKLKLLDGDRLRPYLEEEEGRMAAHELPELYVRNAAVYATRRSVVDAGAIIGADCRAHVMPRERSIDINDELDFELAAYLADKRLRGA